MTPILVKKGGMFMEQKLRCDISIGPNLQKLRNKYGISQEKLCAILQRNGCDIGRTTYAKYENGELNVKIIVLLELKKLYNCAFDALIEDLEERK